MLLAVLGHKGAAIRGARAPRNASPDQSHPVPHHRLLNLVHCALSPRPSCRGFAVVRDAGEQWLAIAIFAAQPIARGCRPPAAVPPCGESTFSPGPGAQLAADRACFPSSSSDAPGPRGQGNPHRIVVRASRSKDGREDCGALYKQRAQPSGCGIGELP